MDSGISDKREGRGGGVNKITGEGRQMGALWAEWQPFGEQQPCNVEGGLSGVTLRPFNKSRTVYYCFYKDQNNMYTAYYGILVLTTAVLNI